MEFGVLCLFKKDFGVFSETSCVKVGEKIY